MVEYRDELFIITDEEMEQLKVYANRLLDSLPSEPTTALLTIAFLKELMEQELGRKVKGIVVKGAESMKCKKHLIAYTIDCLDCSQYFPRKQALKRNWKVKRYD